MSVGAATGGVRVLPATCVHRAPQAFVPAMAFALWSALALMEAEFRWLGCSWLVAVLLLVTLPVQWFFAQVLLLKTGILLSCILSGFREQPIERSRRIVSCVVVAICSAVAWWQTGAGGWAAHLLGVAWVVGLLLICVWLALTSICYDRS